MNPIFLEPSCETFGRVKVVQRAAVITSFFALQSIPCYPYQSFYAIQDPAGQNEVADAGSLRSADNLSSEQSLFSVFRS